jgi:tRNA pseudouridine38-40 synthase
MQSLLPTPEHAPAKQRVALVIQYLGTHFHGWQRQPHHRSVQAELEQVMADLAGHKITLHGAGRTDTGVHAAAMVAHFDTTSPIPAHRWAAALNGRLPADVLVRASAAVSSAWHARFSALWRRYRYTLFTESRPNLFLAQTTWHYYHAPLQAELMHAALQPLMGRHHLAAFRRANSKRADSWLEVQEVDCQRRGPLLDIEVQASGFLYGMMRLLVGLLVKVGSGELSLQGFADLWQQERREQVKYAAPAKGLCFLRVGYPESPFAPEVWYDALPRSSLTEVPAEMPPEVLKELPVGGLSLLSTA